MTHQEVVKKLQAVVAEANEQFKNANEKVMSFPHGLTPKQVVAAAIHSDFAGQEEGSDEFFSLYGLASSYHQLVREKIKDALHEGDIELTPFETILLMHVLEISRLYVPYYRSWLKAMTTGSVASFVKHELETNSKMFHGFISEHGLDNGYTVIHWKHETDGTSYENLTHTPYAEYFKNEIDPILQTMNTFVESTSMMDLREEEQRMVDYIAAYKKALECTDIDSLEELWKQVDILWMDTNSWIQIVHDIESHYGDPIGVKIIPDFSVRFLDESLPESQQTFAESKQVLEKYYTERNTEQSKKGMSALKNSLAGIYYLPFQTGMSIQFKFAGQSIPNRMDVRVQKGVKIYLDYQSTRFRTEKARGLFLKVFGESWSDKMDHITAEDQMMNHIVPHEFGHTIYNFSDFVPEVPETFSKYLEELRADLNALAVLYLRYKEGKLTEDDMYATTLNYIAHELRRYDAWTNTSVKPYRCSMLHIYEMLTSQGIFGVENNEPVLKLENSSAVTFMKSCYDELNRIHALLDNKDTASLQQLLDSITAFETSELSKTILSKLSV